MYKITLVKPVYSKEIIKISIEDEATKEKIENLMLLAPSDDRIHERSSFIFKKMLLLRNIKVSRSRIG